MNSKVNVSVLFCIQKISGKLTLPWRSVGLGGFEVHHLSKDDRYYIDIDPKHVVRKLGTLLQLNQQYLNFHVQDTPASTSRCDVSSLSYHQWRVGLGGCLCLERVFLSPIIFQEAIPNIFLHLLVLEGKTTHETVTFSTFHLLPDETECQSLNGPQALLPSSSSSSSSTSTSTAGELLSASPFFNDPFYWEKISVEASILQQLQDSFEPWQKLPLSDNTRHLLPRGLLLYGPPGTGKTELMKCLTRLHPRIILLGSEKDPVTAGRFFRSKVGRTQKELRKEAELCRAHPDCLCLMLLDEIDTIGKARGKGDQEAFRADFVNALLTLFDSKLYPNLFIIGTTNFKMDLDEALLRPGRMGHHMFLGPLSSKNRIFPVEMPHSQLKFFHGLTANMTRAQFEQPIGLFRYIDQPAGKGVDALHQRLSAFITQSTESNLKWNRFFLRSVMQRSRSPAIGGEIRLAQQSLLDLVQTHSSQPRISGTMTGLFMIDTSAHSPSFSAEVGLGYLGHAPKSCPTVTISPQAMGRSNQLVYQLLFPLVSQFEYDIIDIVDSEAFNPHESDRLDALLRTKAELAQQHKTLLVIFVDSLIGSYHLLDSSNETSRSSSLQNSSSTDQAFRSHRDASLASSIGFSRSDADRLSKSDRISANFSSDSQEAESSDHQRREGLSLSDGESIRKSESLGVGKTEGSSLAITGQRQVQSGRRDSSLVTHSGTNHSSQSSTSLDHRHERSRDRQLNRSRQFETSKSLSSSASNSFSQGGAFAQDSAREKVATAQMSSDHNQSLNMGTSSEISGRSSQAHNQDHSVRFAQGVSLRFAHDHNFLALKEFLAEHRYFKSTNRVAHQEDSEDGSDSLLHIALAVRDPNTLQMLKLGIGWGHQPESFEHSILHMYRSDFIEEYETTQKRKRTKSYWYSLQLPLDLEKIIVHGLGRMHPDLKTALQAHLRSTEIGLNFTE